MVKIGVIEKAIFGIGSYQDSVIVFQFNIKMHGTCVNHIMECGWAHVSEDDLTRADSTYKWKHEDRIKQIGTKGWEVIKLMQDAKVSSLDALVGKPVEVSLEGEFGRCLGIKILKEAIL